MLWAAMPEAAVNEYGNAGACEDEISGAPQTWDWAH
jgi:hypothetical protein